MCWSSEHKAGNAWALIGDYSGRRWQANKVKNMQELTSRRVEAKFPFLFIVAAGWQSSCVGARTPGTRVEDDRWTFILSTLVHKETFENLGSYIRCPKENDREDRHSNCFNFCKSSLLQSLAKGALFLRNLAHIKRPAKSLTCRNAHYDRDHCQIARRKELNRLFWLLPVNNEPSKLVS
jgi:hypothetical protein